MRRKFCLLIPLFIYCWPGIAQNLRQYEPLQCAGIVPADFTRLSSEKFEQDKSRIDAQAKGHIQKSQEQFFLQSNFLIDEVLHSGRVIFGDSVSKYLNGIKDHLLKDDTALRSRIRIYTYRSTLANAYTTNDGMVLVTTGLIARMENEAQLAFILSHEFQHYLHHHALSEYLKKSEMARGKGIYRNLDPDETELKTFQYSKELEREADSLGLQLFMKSDYSISAAQRVFDILLYSYLPFREVPFPEDYFNAGAYRVPDVYFLDSVAPVAAAADYDDSQSTHPNIKSRRAAMIRNVSGLSDAGRNNFIESETLFQNIRKICRYEDCLLNLNNAGFEDAFFDAFLLLQEDPGNRYLKKLMCRALYGSSLYKNDGHATDHDEYYGDVEGESQQVYYFFDKMPNKEFNVLALRYAWILHLSDTSDATIGNICKALASQLLSRFDLSQTDFKDSAPADSLNAATGYEENTAPGNLKAATDLPDDKAMNGTVAYWRYAFVDLKGNAAFDKLMADAANAKKAAATDAKKKGKKEKGYALNISKVVVVNPLYLKIDETRKESFRFIAAEQLKLDLRDKILSCAQALDLDVRYLEASPPDMNDVSKFNDLALLNNWMSEALEHGDVPVINSCNEQMKLLEKKYQTHDFAWIGVIASREKRNAPGKFLLLSLLFPPAIPVAIGHALIPKYETDVFALVANAENNNFKMEYFNSVKSKDKNAIQKGNLYYIMQQIKSKPQHP